MDFKFSAEDEAFRKELRLWLESNAPKGLENSDSFGDEADDSEEWQRRIAWYKKLHQHGWVGIDWPKEYGGRGATILQTIVYHQELARAKAPLPFIGQGATLVGPTLMHWGNQEQKDAHLAKILAGDEIWCQGYSEPNSGSDLASLQTKAVEDGDYFVVNGQKIWTSTAQHADWIFLLVRTDSEAPKHKGISYLLVDMKTPGITVRPLVQMTGASGFNEVFFDDVRVPKRNLVGEKNQGWQVAITTLMFERRGAGAPGTGQIRELARLAKQIPRDGGTALGRLQRAAEDRGVLFRRRGAQVHRLPPAHPPPQGTAARPRRLDDEAGSTELSLKVSLFAMELLGPYSQMEPDGPFAIDSGKWLMKMLAVRGGTIAAGTNQIQHNIIGERVLGLPKG